MSIFVCLDAIFACFHAIFAWLREQRIENGLRLFGSDEKMDAYARLLNPVYVCV